MHIFLIYHSNILNFYHNPVGNLYEFVWMIYLIWYNKMFNLFTAIIIWLRGFNLNTVVMFLLRHIIDKCRALEWLVLQVIICQKRHASDAIISKIIAVSIPCLYKWPSVNYCHEKCHTITSKELDTENYTNSLNIKCNEFTHNKYKK